MQRCRGISWAKQLDGRHRSKANEAKETKEAGENKWAEGFPSLITSKPHTPVPSKASCVVLSVCEVHWVGENGHVTVLSYKDTQLLVITRVWGQAGMLGG